MNTKTNPMLEHATAAATILLIGGLLTCGTAYADAEDAALTEVRAAMASDHDNAIATLKAGTAAQERRFAMRMHQLEPDTQMRLNGHTSDAQALRERGNAARHVRHDARMREAFDERLRAQARSRPDAAEAARTEVRAAMAADHDNAIATLKAGTAAQERRFAMRMHQLEPDTQMRLNGHTSDAQALRERGDAARHVRHDARMREAFDERLRAQARSRPNAAEVASRRTPRAGSVARGAARGMAVGWATDTALGMHVPDAFDAASWTAGTLQRPQDTPKRLDQLAIGAVHFTGQVATRLTRPDRMAVNLVNGGARLVNTGAHVVTHPRRAIRRAGKAAKSFFWLYKVRR